MYPRLPLNLGFVLHRTTLTLAAATVVATGSPPAHAINSTPRVQIDQNGDFLLIGNVLGHDCRIVDPTVGTVGACGSNTGDTAIDIYWTTDGTAVGTVANTSVTNSESSNPAVLTVDELADLLRVSRDTAYKAINAGDIPGVRRVGKAIRISRVAVLEWLRGKDPVPRSRRKT